MRTFSGPGLLFFTLTVSVAVVDWIMVLEREWYSTIFPVLFIIGGILSILAFCTVLLIWLGNRNPGGPWCGPSITIRWATCCSPS